MLGAIVLTLMKSLSVTNQRSWKPGFLNCYPRSLALHANRWNERSLALGKPGFDVKSGLRDITHVVESLRR